MHASRAPSAAGTRWGFEIAAALSPLVAATDRVVQKKMPQGYIIALCATEK